MVKAGDRVQITTEYFNGAINGTGTVMYVNPREMLQVGVQLDKPCNDGHYFYRFTYNEIKIIGG